MSDNLMDFETWWHDVWHQGFTQATGLSPAHDFMESYAKDVASKAWDAGRMVLREEIARRLRQVELERREHAKRQR